MSRRRRPPAWRAITVPDMARSLSRQGRAEAARLAALADRARLTVPHRPELAAALDDGARAAQAGADTAASAELYWVSGDMARIAMDAAQDVPALLDIDAPTTKGLIVFAVPLPSWDTSGTGGLALRDGTRTDIAYHEPVPVDALMWDITTHDTRTILRVELHTRPTNLPLPLLGYQGPFLIPFTSITQALPAPLDDGGLVIAPQGVMAASDHIGVLALLEAVWVLMATPSVATTSPANPPTGRRPATSRRSPTDVTIIDVRPARRALLDPHPNLDTQTPRRRLTSRHVVRGHWKMQPHGPQRSKRKLLWVDDYIRGPANTPLVTRTHVWAWRH